MNFNENYLKNKKPSGQISMYMHQGGEIKNGKVIGGVMLKESTIQNLIVDKASELMAARMAPRSNYRRNRTCISREFP
jgi:hypothetical protein